VTVYELVAGYLHRFKGPPHESTQANRIKGRFRVCTGMGGVQSAQRVALLRDQAVLLTFGLFPGQ